MVVASSYRVLLTVLRVSLRPHDRDLGKYTLHFSMSMLNFMNESLDGEVNVDKIIEASFPGQQSPLSQEHPQPWRPPGQFSLLPSSAALSPSCSGNCFIN